MQNIKPNPITNVTTQYDLCTSIDWRSTRRCASESRLRDAKKAGLGLENLANLSNINEDDIDNVSLVTENLISQRACINFSKEGSKNATDPTQVRTVFDKKASEFKINIEQALIAITEKHKKNCNKDISLDWDQIKLLEKTKNRIRVLLDNRFKLKIRMDKAKVIHPDRAVLSMCHYNFLDKNSEKYQNLKAGFERQTRQMILEDLQEKIIIINDELNVICDDFVNKIFDKLKVKDTFLVTFDNRLSAERAGFILKDWMSKLIFRENLKELKLSKEKILKEEQKNQALLDQQKDKDLHDLKNAPSAYSSGKAKKAKKPRHKKINVAKRPL